MVDKILSDARNAVKSGNFRAAASAYDAVLMVPALTQNHCEAHLFLGRYAFSTQDHTAAIDHYNEALSRLTPDFGQAKQTQPRDVIEYELGRVYEAAEDLHAAATQYLKARALHPQNARHYLFAGAAFHAQGETETALQLWSLGSDIDPILRTAQYHPNADDATKTRSRVADQALRNHFTKLHQSTVGNDPALARIQKALWPQTHTAVTDYKTKGQQPFMFYVPDLPAHAYFDDLHWYGTAAAGWKNVRDEYTSAIGSLSGAPYVSKDANFGQGWDAIKGSMDWEALHLYKDGKANEDLTEYFPQTLALLEKLPLVLVDGRPLEVFFSTLKPHTDIPKHFGLANSRMTCHLPLIIPDECGIKVHEETRKWREGEMICFDDSFEHQAWNHSDNLRAVLIFEAWHPDLTQAERTAISNSFSGRTKWLAERALPSIA